MKPQKILKQRLILKEQIANAKAAIQKVTMASAESAADSTKAVGKAAASAAPPFNLVPIAIAVGQAALTAKSMIKAVASAKKAAGGMGGGGSVSPVSVAAPAAQPAAFNVVGTAPENQLADSIAGQNERPIKAFVVSDEVSTAQALDRNIIESASIG